MSYTLIYMISLYNKQILNIFADAARLDVGRLKLLYSKEAIKNKPSVFEDIFDVFRHFSNYTFPTS